MFASPNPNPQGGRPSLVDCKKMLLQHICPYLPYPKTTFCLHSKYTIYYLCDVMNNSVNLLNVTFQEKGTCLSKIKVLASRAEGREFDPNRIQWAFSSCQKPFPHLTRHKLCDVRNTRPWSWFETHVKLYIISAIHFHYYHPITGIIESAL